MVMSAVKAGGLAAPARKTARDHHLSGMKNLELSDEEEAILAVELDQLISRAKSPFSDRVRTLCAILNKLRPEPAGEPFQQ